MGADLRAAVERHCELFNNCVGTADWAPFIASLTEDARMTLPGRPATLLAGRAAIAAAYAARPPAEKMFIRRVEPVAEETVRVHFAWQSGGQGSMVVTWQGGAVAAVDLSS